MINYILPASTPRSICNQQNCHISVFWEQDCVHWFSHSFVPQKILYVIQDAPCEKVTVSWLKNKAPLEAPLSAFCWPTKYLLSNIFMWKTALSDYLFKTIWGVMDWKNKGIKNTKLHGDNFIFFSLSSTGKHAVIIKTFYINTFSNLQSTSIRCKHYLDVIWVTSVWSPLADWRKRARRAALTHSEGTFSGEPKSVWRS